MKNAIGCAVGATSLLLACASSQSQPTDDSACANYSGAPTIVDGEADPRELPACKPRCGSQQVDTGGYSLYLAKDLPAGPCDAAAAECKMEAWGMCLDPNGAGHGPADGYRCQCVTGNWQCVLEFPGGSIGSCAEPPDSGLGDGASSD